MSQDAELFQLLSAYFAGTLSPAEAARLRARAQAEPAVVEEIARMVTVERAIAWEHHEHDAGTFAREVLHRLANPEPAQPEPLVLRVLADVEARRVAQSRRWKRWIPLAAAALLMLGVGIGWWRGGFGRGKDDTRKRPVENDRQVAVITNVDKVQWADGSPQLTAGQAMKPETLRL